jgi:pimeloyl-ACP methyl ester carboxylesterase
MKYILLIISIIAFTSYSNAQCSLDITATIFHADSLATGDVLIRPRSGVGCNGFNNLSKPIIFIESFDFLNEITASGTYNDLNQPISGTNTRALNILRANGFDVIVLNFDDATNYIQSNAFLLAELITQINTNKISNEELMVIGYGMGGLVARYALAYMEGNNLDHETGLYVSLDAPHKGLNFPIGLQLFINDFLGNALIAPVAEQVLEFGAILESPAFKQLVPYQLPLPTSFSPHRVALGQTHIDFYEELRNLNSCNGYPIQSRNVAASLGSWNQNQQISNSVIDSTSMKPFLQYAGVSPTLLVNLLCPNPPPNEYTIIQFMVNSLYNAN